MTKKTDDSIHRIYLERVVRVWQMRLRLEYWDIVIDLDNPPVDENQPEDKQPHASVEFSDHYDNAVIKFNKNWTTWDQKTANINIVHELLHLMSRDEERIIFENVDKTNLNYIAKGIIVDNYHHHHECFIDTLAKLLVEGYGVLEE